MEPSEIKWKRHEYHTFYAKMKIRLGDKNTSYTLDKGDEFEFDGTMCKYAGTEFSQPSLRGAINSGWASLDENDTSRIQPRVAARAVAKATSINRDLSKVQLQNSDQMEAGEADEDTVLHLGDRRAAMADPNRGHLTTADNRRRTRVAGMRVEEGIEDQGEVFVSNIKTPARRSVDVSVNPNKAREIETQSYESGFGRSRQIEGIDIKMNVGSVRGSVPVEDIEDEGEVIAQVRQSPKTRSVEGVTITDTSNIRSQPKVRRVAPAPAPAPAEASSDPKHKLSVAQSIYSKFPADWNFFAKSDDKLARIEQLGANKNLIQALMASESKTMKKVLAEKYPKFQPGRTG